LAPVVKLKTNKETRFWKGFKNMEDIYIMDQFYTKKEVAEECYAVFRQQVDATKYDIILEPSAGTGSFYTLLPEHQRAGIDIDPKCDGVIQQDFLDYVPEENKRHAVIGNPPFGRVSSLAVKFFNKAAQFSDIIAFIVPRTFKRVSVQNKLNLQFHLVLNKDLPMMPCCFEPKMGAKCCFQLWERRSEKRVLVSYNKSHKDFEFLKHGPLDQNKQPTPPSNADFVVKAYGGNCGEVKKQNLEVLRPKSWHWIKSNIDINTLIDRINSLDFTLSKDTVRQDSIGQQELIYLYESKFGV
jgi:predicted RNA methylase